MESYDDAYPDFDAVADDAGGTILSWQVGNVDPDLWVQRIDADGQRPWGQAKLVVAAAGGQKA